uniref:Uncharacterized protein n=1 Tax=Romanomermis culicivorax TaxID=13658 RepID=A0A915KFE1_ROMCU
MKKHNPFDKSFLDANQKIKSDDGIDQILCFLSSTEQSTTSSFDTSTNLPSISDTSSTPLSLKLNESPPLVESLDSVTISTPEITNLGERIDLLSVHKINQVSPISRFVTPPPTADVLDVVLQLSEKSDRPDITQKFEAQVNNDCEEPFARPPLIVLEKNTSSSLCNKNISLDTPTLLPASVSTVAQSDHVYDSSIPGQLSFLPN